MSCEALILMPAYNEEANIGSTLSKIPNSIHVLVINDGSTDKTKDICKGKNITVINHSINRGYEQALQSGVEFFLKSEYSRFVVVDADGEIEPVDAILILEKISESVPIICGYRKNHSGRISEKIVRKIARRFFGVSDLYCGCKGFHRSIISGHNAKAVCASIFIEFVLQKSRSVCVVNMPVGGSVRIGQSRFGSGFFTNMKLLLNFFLVVIKTFYPVINLWRVKYE